MIIVNADDWGRTRSETDKALSCYREGRITSTSAMVFMQDSVRASELARESGINVGLHLNLSQQFTDKGCRPALQENQNRIIRFLVLSKYAFLLYNPILRRQFAYVYQAQREEFLRLYEKLPSHTDGHQHMHLCTNLLLDRLIPSGERVRRNFSFWPGEKCFLNRAYRSLVDHWLTRRYIITDYFFSLARELKMNNMKRVIKLASDSSVELMTHPTQILEYEFLMSNEWFSTIEGLKRCIHFQVQDRNISTIR